MVCMFPCGEPVTVLQAEANEEVDFSVGYVHDRLNTSQKLLNEEKAEHWPRQHSPKN